MSIKKILIVDDSATQRAVMRDLLLQHGYRVLEAENGEQGITIAQSEFPDLILMDVVMPGVNGFQATRTLSRDTTTRHIPIIICSSKQQETDKVWGMRQGAHAYFVKPVDTTQLLDTIAALNKSVAAL
jgi:twitching motility two-component system response regulator PilH